MQGAMINVSGHRYWWLASCYGLEIWHVWKWPAWWIFSGKWFLCNDVSTQCPCYLKMCSHSCVKTHIFHTVIQAKHAHQWVKYLISQHTWRTNAVCHTEYHKSCITNETNVLKPLMFMWWTPYTPFTLGHGSHVSGHRCRTSAKRDWRETTQEDGCTAQGNGCTNVIAVVAVPDF